MRPRIVLIIVFLLFIGCISIATIPTYPTEWHHRGDFGHYYASAVRMLHHKNPYEGTLEEILLAHHFPLDRIEWRATNPPALIFLTIPLTFFSHLYAFWIWNLFQIGVFVTGALCFFHRIGRAQDKAFMARSILGLVLSVPFLMHIQLAQTQLLIAGLVMIGLSRLEQNPRIANLLLGTSASLKLFTLPLGIVTLRYAYTQSGRNKYDWLFFPIGFLALSLLAELWSYGGIHKSYIHNVIPFVGQLQFHITGGTSLAFLLFFLIWKFVYHLDAPLNLPEIVGSMINTIVIGVLLVLLTIENFVNTKPFSPFRSGLYCLVASILCSPVAWPHYFVLLFPPLVYLWNSVTEGNLREKLLFGGLYLLTALTPGFAHALPLVTAFWGPTVLLLTLLWLLVLERDRSPTFHTDHSCKRSRGQISD